MNLGGEGHRHEIHNIQLNPGEYRFFQGIVLGFGDGHVTQACSIMARFPKWRRGKEFACNAGDARDTGLIPELGRSPGGGRGNPLQYSCLEDPMEEEPGRLQSMGLRRDRYN